MKRSILRRNEKQRTCQNWKIYRKPIGRGFSEECGSSGEKKSEWHPKMRAYCTSFWARVSFISWKLKIP